MTIDIKKLKEVTAENGLVQANKIISEIEREIQDSADVGYSAVSYRLSTGWLLNKAFAEKIEKHFRDLGFTVDVEKMDLFSDTTKLWVAWMETEDE
jgi:hypothetical protein